MAKRRGFALAVALVAVVLIAALLAALFFAVNEETRTGMAMASRDEALAAAETAIHSTLEQVETAELQPVGSVEIRSLSAGGLSSIVYVTRLDSTLFWLAAAVSNERNASVSTRRIGVLAAASVRQDDSIRIVRVTRRGWSELY